MGGGHMAPPAENRLLSVEKIRIFKNERSKLIKSTRSSFETIAFVLSNKESFLDTFWGLLLTRFCLYKEVVVRQSIVILISDLKQNWIFLRFLRFFIIYLGRHIWTSYGFLRSHSESFSYKMTNLFSLRERKSSARKLHENGSTYTFFSFVYKKVGLNVS